jgi:hypothetical protein
VEAYNRQERETIYSPETQFRLLADGSVGFPQPGPVLGNALDGYARGAEISVQRRSANRLSGWVNYSRSYTKYWQPGTSLNFWGDFDQRNTFTAYGSLRLTPNVNLSSSARYGSGYPLVGYIQGPLDFALLPGGLLPFHLTALPNQTRLPSYQSVDCRLNKTFTNGRRRLTLYVEAANITNHDNWRYFDYLIPPTVQYLSLIGRFRENTMPLLPAVGMSLEF